ncbi:hypothetical protein JTE90_018858 [Oedothorax gibbosus]|uniref:Uncharacterized protein n=1 Tax=Oedothorax gibbosus TaxID=931172 RepID=A0AAV6TVU9_9ARAC|nr:hypothetical protein JTE90_018858 [Oedothorax gibbosus]
MLLGEKIAKSKLAPWQRLDALKTFFFPAFVFQMRTEQLSKGDMKVVDDFIRPLIKDTLYVDESAANEYIYGSSKMGLLGIPRLADEVDIMMIDNAFKLLSSKDIRIHELAWEDILESITTRTGLDPSPSLIEKYLNGAQGRNALIWCLLFCGSFLLASFLLGCSFFLCCVRCLLPCIHVLQCHLSGDCTCVVPSSRLPGPVFVRTKCNALV